MDQAQHQHPMVDLSRAPRVRSSLWKPTLEGAAFPHGSAALSPHPSPHFSFSGPGELLPISPRIFLTPHGSVSPPCRPPLCQSSHTIFHTHCCSHTLTITCLLNRNRDLAGPGPCRIPACGEGVTSQNRAPAGCLLK